MYQNVSLLSLLRFASLPPGLVNHQTFYEIFSLKPSLITSNVIIIFTSSKTRWVPLLWCWCSTDWKAQNPELAIYFAACFIFRKLFLFDFEQSQHIVEQLQQFNIIPRISWLRAKENAAISPRNLSNVTLWTTTSPCQPEAIKIPSPLILIKSCKLWSWLSSSSPSPSSAAAHYDFFSRLLTVFDLRPWLRLMSLLLLITLSLKRICKEKLETFL